ncbi:AIR synthase-related protein [Syntrophorhabdus aromaticivorans]|uniref:AIR synthase-related protein n=1 Tax=Syntrophorhabdus aromaticivorans TaxID=328301 RepID=UPI0003FE5B10|nr:AIR synthase-related protein [Syntrophorhabdus aromaticivorans]
MAHRIEVAYKAGTLDVPGEKLKKKIKRDMGFDVEAKVVDAYIIDAPLSADILDILKTDVFVDPVIQKGYLDKPAPMEGDWAIEVSFKPGVTDNVGRTAREVIESLSGHRFERDEKVYTSRVYFLKGTLSETDVTRLAEDMLANTVINRYVCKNAAQYEQEQGMGAIAPKMGKGHEPTVEVFPITTGLEEIMRINRERTWALSADELKAIRRYFLAKSVIEARNKVGLTESPTDVEMEALAQTWSEHCKHKIFNAVIEYEEDGKKSTIDSLFKTYIVGSTDTIRRRKGKKDFCLSVFKDNAGVIRFNKKFNLAFKVETHNTPSALDPYGGALTGIVGVNRDPFGTGMGAKLIFNTDVFCFAPPDYRGSVPPRLLHPKRVMEGVREGVEHGGNKSGIPTVNGSLVFDLNYLGKPLVFCGTCGIMPRTIQGKPSYEKKARKGDAIVMVGGKIGKDGIHGATFSSEELSEVSPTSAVQIGDPITQKRMTDFLLVARDKGLYTSITDNGAGGLSSSVGEMAEDTNGCILHLDRAPLKYQGLLPWEILLSEAQERMNVAVAPENLDEFLRLSEEMNVTSTVLGEFTDTGKLHILHGGKTVAYLDMDFLHHGLPKMRLTAKWERKIRDEKPIGEPRNYGDALMAVLGRWNVCSKEYVVRQYDHEVQGGSIIKPLAGLNNNGPSDAAVVRPDLDSREGAVVSHGICPKYSAFDTYHMMACAIDEAIRNNIAGGGSLDRMALLDNFCWSDPVLSEKNPEGSYKLAQLVRANKALYDYTTLFGTPCISGKDSMKNDYMFKDIKISVPQTILVSCLSVIKDVKKAMTIDFKKAGDLVIIVGTTYAEMGGTEYFSEYGLMGNIPPRVRGSLAKKTFKAVQKAMGMGLVRSCHDVSDGGMGCALAESAFAGGIGVDVDLAAVPLIAIFRDDFVLFSESPSRFIISVKEEDLGALTTLFGSIPFGVLGKTRDDKRFIIRGLQGKQILDVSIDALLEAWQAPFKKHFSA